MFCGLECMKGDDLVYAIFFGTKNLQGSDKMKQAIWSVDPFGDNRLYGDHHGQLVLAGAAADLTPVRKQLVEFFGTERWIAMADLVNYMKSDRTMFHSGHLKNDTLRPMEIAGQLVVRSNTYRRRGYFPDDAEIKFLSNAPEQARFFG